MTKMRGKDAGRDTSLRFGMTKVRARLDIQTELV